jgi:hypothetical protein
MTPRQALIVTRRDLIETGQRQLGELLTGQWRRLPRAHYVAVVPITEARDLRCRALSIKELQKPHQAPIRLSA